MNAIKKIKTFIKYINDININVLSSSLTFYLLIVYIPLMSTINIILSYLGFDYKENFLIIDNSLFSTILLFISMVFIISKLTKILTTYTEIIYQDKQVFNSFKLKIRSIILVIIILIMIVLLIIVLTYSEYFIQYFLKIKNKIFVNVSQIIISFISIVIINSFIYKYIVPIKVKVFNMINASLITTISWYLLSLIYKYNVFFFQTYYPIYQQFAEFVILIWFIYFFSYSFLFGIGINCYLKNLYKNEENSHNNIEQKR